MVSDVSWEAPDRIRTGDLFITSELLYLLSHGSNRALLSYYSLEFLSSKNKI